MMDYSGAERRRWPRVNLNLPIRFREVGEFSHSPLDSETKDISEGGARFQTDKFLPKDSRLVISIDLTDEPGVKATVKVVWSVRDPHTNMYEIGVEFDTIPSEAKVELSNMVRKNLN